MSEPTPTRPSKWSRWLLWGVGIVGAVALTIAVTLTLLLRGGPVHRYVLAKLRQQASAALHGPVDIGDFHVAFSLRYPSADLERVRVQGSGPANQPPLFQARHVHVGIAVTSLWKRQWHFSVIELNHPQIDIRQDKNGHTNLPSFGSGGGKGTNLFTLGIRHVVITNGEVRFNSRSSRIDADIRNLHLATTYTPSHQEYQGTVSFHGGTLQIQKFLPMTEALSANFVASAGGVRIRQFHWQGAGADVEANAQLRSYSDPHIQAQYHMTVELDRLGQILHAGGMPAGTVTANGRAQYAAPSKGGWLDGLETQGRWDSSRLEARAGGTWIPVSNLSGAYRLAQGNVSVTGIRGRVMGGGLSAEAWIRNLTGTQFGQFTARLSGAHLAAAQAVGPKSVREQFGQLGVGGRVDATVNGGWRGGLNTLHMQIQAKAQATFAGSGTGAKRSGAVPLTATVAMNYANATLSFQNTTLRTPATTVTVNGTLGLGGSSRTALQVRADSGNLSDVETVADKVRLATGGAALPALGVQGRGRLRAEIRGAITAPDIQATLSATGLRVRQSAWRSVAVTLDAAPDQVRVSSAELVPAAGGSIRLSGSTGLAHWAWQKSEPIRLSAQVDQVPLTPIGELLGRTLPVTGTLSAQAQVSGTAEAPTGQAHVSLARGEYRSGKVQQPFSLVTLTAQGDAETITGRVQGTLPAGTVTVAGNYHPQQRSYQATLDVPALAIGRLKAIGKTPVAGTIAIHGSGSGTVDNPQFSATVSAPVLRMDGQDVRDLKLVTDIANHSLHARLRSTAVATTISADATIGLTKGLPAQISVNTSVIPVATVLAVYAPAAANAVTGQAEIHATATGNLENVRGMQAHVQIPVLVLHYGQAVGVRAATPLRIDVANGTATVASTRLTGNNTDITIGGMIPLENQAPMRVSAKGSINLKLLNVLNPELQSAGEARLQVNVGGDVAKPSVSGEVDIVNASVGTRSLPVSLQQGNGKLILSGNRLTISDFTGRVGGGPLRLTGAVLLQQTPRFDVAAQLSQVRILYPDNVRETMSGSVAFSGTPEAAQLSGRIQVQDVQTSSQFDFTSALGQFSGVNGVVSAPGSFAQNVRLNVAVTTPNEIRTTTRDFSLQANANITVRGTIAEPVILGRISIDSGDLIFRGNRYQLTGGTLDFVNPSRTQAVVNISADTTIQQYDLSLHFQGPTDNLRTNYTSDPSLPPADIINLLAFGQTTESSAANPTPGNLGAESLVASEVTSQITDRVQKIAGISQLSVNPILGNGQQAAGAQITVQQRVTGNLFVTISTDVTAAQRDSIQIQYRISPRVSVSGVRDQNGSYGVTTTFKHSW